MDSSRLYRQSEKRFIQIPDINLHHVVFVDSSLGSGTLAQAYWTQCIFKKYFRVNYMVKDDS